MPILKEGIEPKMTTHKITVDVIDLAVAIKKIRQGVNALDNLDIRKMEYGIKQINNDIDKLEKIIEEGLKKL